MGGNSETADNFRNDGSVLAFRGFVPVRSHPRKVPTARKGSTTMGCVSWHLRCRNRVSTSRNDLKLLAKDILRCQVKIPLLKDNKAYIRWIECRGGKGQNNEPQTIVDGMKNEVKFIEGYTVVYLLGQGPTLSTRVLCLFWGFFTLLEHCWWWQMLGRRENEKTRKRETYGWWKTSCTSWLQ